MARKWNTVLLRKATAQLEQKVQKELSTKIGRERAREFSKGIIEG